MAPAHRATVAVEGCNHHGAMWSNNRPVYHSTDVFKGRVGAWDHVDAAVVVTVHTHNTIINAMLVSTSLSTSMYIHALAFINGIASGVKEVEQLFRGLFAALEKDTTPPTLGVDHLKVEQDGVFSQVFLLLDGLAHYCLMLSLKD